MNYSDLDTTPIEPPETFVKPSKSQQEEKMHRGIQ